MKKKPITIYHIHFFDIPLNEQRADKDYYFGSISAIYGVFEIPEIGISAPSLYNLKLDEIENPIYKNKRCRIRKSTLITKSQSK